VSSLPRAIFRTWIHSHEEDTPEVSVYRPRGHPLPAARGREGFEIHENGRFVHYGIAAGEGARETVGRWTAESPDRIRLEFPEDDSGGAAVDRDLSDRLTIESCAAEKLEIRR
jgi:hypothetical protein